jgi:hypothetical protein
MIFAHGSKNNIVETSKSGLQLFDYVLKNDGTCSIPEIEEGNDGEGPGIYAFFDKETDYSKIIDGACHYVGNNDQEQLVYKFQIDVEDDELINNRSQYDIPAEQWVETVEYFIEKMRANKRASFEEFEKISNELVERFGNGENPTLEFVNNRMSEGGVEIEFVESDPDNFDDAYEFGESLSEEYALLEPCSYIIDNGGAEEIVNHAIESSNNQWEVIKSIWNTIAVHQSNEGLETYNETFQDAVLTVLEEYNLAVALVDNDNFAVIFDSTLINIDSVLDMKNEEEYSFKEFYKITKAEKKDRYKLV